VEPHPVAAAPPTRHEEAGGTITERSSAASCSGNAPASPGGTYSPASATWKTVYLGKRRRALDGTWQRIAERLGLDAD
jgi:hypothetical protein